jgi:hypothetical protein
VFPIPYDRFTIETHFSREELSQRVAALMIPKRKWRQALSEAIDQTFRGIGGTKTPDRLEGTLTAEGFRGTRVIRYGNSFLPVIRGRFIARVDGGTDVRVSMRLHWFTLFFMLAWLFFVASVAGFPVQRLLAGNALEATDLVTVGMVLFGIALTLAGFWPEARKARRLLTETLGDGGVAESA